MIMILPLTADTKNSIFLPENILPMKITDIEKSKLLSKHEITTFLSPEVKPGLFPNTVLSREIKREISNFKYTIGVESIFLIPVPDHKLDEYLKEDFKSRKIRLFNILRSVSTLEGITYYSESKKSIRVLYSQSYAINNLKEKTRISDPIVKNTSPLSKMYMYQKDASFGKTIYEIIYKTTYNEISLSMKNVVKFQKGIITLIEKGKMQLHIIVYPLDNGFLFYGLCLADASCSDNLKKKLNKSFFNRIQAYRIWFGEMVRK